MNFEALQKTWQAQAASAKVTVSMDVLLREVQRNQRQFSTTIFWRDVREVGACGLMTLFFGGWGWRWQWWSLYLLAFCCFLVGVFFLTDRLHQRRKQPVKNDSLHDCLQSSLHQVNHQIWLLKNIFWWYLLPILIGVSAVTGATVWSVQMQGWAAMLSMGAVYVIVYGTVYGGVYWLNQYAVRKTLEPRRRELETLLASLGNGDGLKN